MTASNHSPLPVQLTSDPTSDPEPFLLFEHTNPSPDPDIVERITIRLESDDSRLVRIAPSHLWIKVFAPYQLSVVREIFSAPAASFTECLDEHCGLFHYGVRPVPNFGVCRGQTLRLWAYPTGLLRTTALQSLPNPLFATGELVFRQRDGSETEDTQANTPPKKEAIPGPNGWYI